MTDVYEFRAYPNRGEKMKVTKMKVAKLFALCILAMATANVYSSEEASRDERDEEMEEQQTCCGCVGEAVGKCILCLRDQLKQIGRLFATRQPPARVTVVPVEINGTQYSLLVRFSGQSATNGTNSPQGSTLRFSTPEVPSEAMRKAHELHGIQRALNRKPSLPNTVEVLVAFKEEEELLSVPGYVDDQEVISRRPPFDKLTDEEVAHVLQARHPEELQQRYVVPQLSCVLFVHAPDGQLTRVPGFSTGAEIRSLHYNPSSKEQLDAGNVLKILTALSTLRTRLDRSSVTNALNLQEPQAKFLVARADAGGTFSALRTFNFPPCISDVHISDNNLILQCTVTAAHNHTTVFGNAVPCLLDTTISVFETEQERRRHAPEYGYREEERGHSAEENGRSLATSRPNPAVRHRAAWTAFSESSE